MIGYVIRRLLLLPVVVFGVILMVFGVLQLIPPVQRAAVFVDGPEELKNLDVDVLIERFDLDEPAWKQFSSWFVRLIHGDWGWSATAKRPVLGCLKRFAPQSAELALWAILPIIFGGIWLGVVSAKKQNHPIDLGIRVFVIVGWSLPGFVAGILGLALLYGLTGWFPPGRLGLEAAAIVYSTDFIIYTGIITLDAILNWNWFVFADALRHLVLPVIVTAYVSWAMILRVTRSSMLESLRQEFVMTARSKGLLEKVVINKHVRRNALIPVGTISGLTVAFLFNGMAVAEYIFELPGLGRWAAIAAKGFDLPAMLGYLLFNGALIVMANLAIDIMYVFIDPRVRLE